MELSETDEFGLDKRTGDHLNYQSSGLTSEWQFNHQSINLSSSCPSISMVDSLCSNLYNSPSNPQNPIDKTLPMGWNQGILPSSFSHFPTDSDFIERAAKFSCYSGGNFSSMLNNPFIANESLGSYPIATKTLSDSQSPMNDQRDVKESNIAEGKAELSGDGQENSSSKENGPKKRKRINQDMEMDQLQKASPLSIETTKDNVLDTKQKGGQDSSTMSNAKPSGSNAQNSTDDVKEDYIHVRARRGQATNSHSLAERVRREKISERMKFLQDLVPGCSKVTGKAVMLDEIINYVQSLQRQVEFLSMKLAAVNPRLDCSLEGLLSKDLRGCSSSAIGFSPQRIHPQLHPSQQGLIQAGITSMSINAQMPQAPHTWEDELDNVLQMNFGNAIEPNAKPRDGFLL